MTEDDGKTVIQPGIGSGAPPPEPAAPHAAPPPASEPPTHDATIIAPGISGGGGPGPAPAEPSPFDFDPFAPPPAQASAPPAHDATIIAPGLSGPGPTTAPPPPDPQPFTPPPPVDTKPRAQGTVQIGDVLNHIYEVKRFIARGGMGEVYEGANAANGERVAIKIILPALSADANVIEMFRKEASTLGRLSHPALVQYRLMTKEPQLGCYYIVTDYIDGTSLSDVLGKIQPSPAELVGLTRRLAEGLRAAHELGAIHRDITPDNVLLPGGQLDRARVIDFGIAKDVDPGSKTIIGDGFAGKLGYVAPEQLGDFNRDVGSWSDVYSLGLVILAVAQGEGAKLGGSFVDAIDKRRKGIDTSGAAPQIRPLLDAMLAYDPAKRLRTMDDVLAKLATLKLGGAAPAKKKPEKKKPEPGAPAEPRKPLPKPALIGGGAAVVLVLAGLAGWLAFGGGGSQAPTPAPAASTLSVASVSQAVEAALPGLACTWMNVQVSATGADFALTGTGVAGRPQDAEPGVFAAAQRVGAKIDNSDFSGVSPIDTSFCPLLDRLRPLRVTGQQHLSVSQNKYELSMQTQGQYAGSKGATVIIDLSLAGVAGDFALLGIDKQGEISMIVPTREQFLAAAKASGAIEKLEGQDQYRISLDGNPAPGWAGILLLSGQGPFDATLLKDVTSKAAQAKFDETAKNKGWKAEMAWFRFVDEQPN